MCCKAGCQRLRRDRRHVIHRQPMRLGALIEAESLGQGLHQSVRRGVGVVGIGHAGGCQGGVERSENFRGIAQLRIDGVRAGVRWSGGGVADHWHDVEYGRGDATRGRNQPAACQARQQ